MSVVGFDLGTQNSRVAVIRGGGVEVICNEVSDRATPTMVSFDAKRRYAGDPSRTQQVGNFRNTVVNLTRLIGRIPEEELAKKEEEFQTCTLTSKEGTLSACVEYRGEKANLSATELMGTFLNKLKKIANSETKAAVKDIVISVPSFFGEKERRALEDAAEIVGLNCLRTINDVTAAAICYGMTKTDIPSEKPRIIAIVDVGYASSKACIAAIQKGSIEILAHVSDSYLGGRDFDQVLVDHFARHYANLKNVDFKASKKVLLRLRIACERIKKILSGIQMTRMELEALLDGMDFVLEMSRSDFEELSKHLIQRTESLLGGLISKSGLKQEDIESVEIIGGCTRIPAVKACISRVFNKEISTTLNADEAVSRGCALACAIDSPLVRVREFKVVDKIPYPIVLSLSNDETIGKFDMEAKINHPITLPISSQHATFPLSIGAYYASSSQTLPGTPNQVARFTITLPKSLDPTTIKKLSITSLINNSGCVEITEATAETETSEPVPAEESNAEALSPSRVVSRVWPLSIKSETFRIPRQALNALKDAELEMSLRDELVAETDDAKNAVEECIFEVKQKVDGSLSTFIKEDEKCLIRSKLDEYESWLYSDDGMDVTKEEYQKVLSELRSLVAPFEQLLQKELRETLNPISDTNSPSPSSNANSKSTENLNAVEVPTMDMD